MIGFIIILLQSHLWAKTTAPGCQDLSRILSSAEKEIMSAHVKGCSELDLASLLPKEIASETQEFFNEHKCSPLYQIETQIAELENQEALLLGFEKLKNQISSAQETVSEEKDKQTAEQVAKDLVQALNTAQSIEIMLDSQIPDKDVNYLQLLAAELPEQWEDLEKLRSITAQFCEKVTDASKLRVCSSDFAPNEETHKELRELLRTGSLSAEEAEQWKKSLSIQKVNGENYSFLMMTDAIRESYNKVLNNEPLNEEELNSIRVLDRFRSNPHFSFARKLPTPQGDTLVQAKIKSLTLGLKKRQEVEMNTKMSVVASINKDLLNEEEKASCSNVKSLDDFDTTCLGALKTALDRAKSKKANDQTAQLTEAINAFTRSQSYIEKLNELSSKCETNLEECALNLPLEIGSISDRLSALRVIKEKVGSDQNQNITFRNFALSKFNKNCSSDVSVEKSIVEECNDTLSSMAPEMFKLSSSLMDISLMIDPKNISDEDEKVKALCENSEVKKLADQRKLCAFFTDAVSDELPKDKEDKVNPDSYTAPVTAPKGSNSNRESWLKGLAMLANTAADTWIANNNTGYWGPQINPYAYNYGPYPMMGAMSTSDSILFNARYYGAYGFYMPTQGLQPYTTFGTGSITSYSSLPRSSSSYSYFAK